ncbi:signal peptidase I [Desulfurivibrio alkaliphilus]|uniref:Signal peptidase I n=1 Tax=Desulfurivibrio alkaliphilus (strain DSM 19089 / UNIQEM U267 / AHT2) TaxID=589865 RepID=D6Z6Z2_DESAT|nr:signal peptidase I [Desulfurivibrio alkaliphilus]ADH86979.1 signal peptidase I [Desulfurivibrio alkaliphilus AHT 2]
MTDNNRESSRKSVFREYAEAIIVALLLALLIRTFVVQAFKIPSGSMEPTLLIGDHLLVNKFVYGVRNPFSGEVWVSLQEPKRYDVVVFRYPRNPRQDYIKRIIGLPGETVEIRDKQVYIDGEPLEDPRAVFRDDDILPPSRQPRDNFGPVKVGPDELFTLGDNRDNSHDSRFWGMVETTALRGKAFVLYWSWDHEETGVRWNRLGQRIE